MKDFWAKSDKDSKVIFHKRSEEYCRKLFFHEKYLHNILRYSMIVQSVKVTKSSERIFLK